jgi:hypothetical protein
MTVNQISELFHITNLTASTSSKPATQYVFRKDEHMTEFYNSTITWNCG